MTVLGRGHSCWASKMPDQKQNDELVIRRDPDRCGTPSPELKHMNRFRGRTAHAVIIRLYHVREVVGGGAQKAVWQEDGPSKMYFTKIQTGVHRKKTNSSIQTMS